MIPLRQTRRVCKASLTRVSKFCESIDQQNEIENCEARLERLERLLQEFIRSNEQMYAFEEEDGFIDPADEMEEFENLYYECKAVLAKAINMKRKASFSEEDINDSSSKSNQVITVNTTASSLPVIKIPTFTGNCEDWPSFKDMFENAVHNKPGLTPHLKFQYLKSILDGEPLRLIKHIKVSDKNYEDAWTRLDDRYNNKLQIINSYIDSYLSLSKQNGNSVESLRKITDRADEILRGLRSSNAECLDYWLIFILLQKLDTSVRREWARYYTESDGLYTTKHFMNFLDHYCCAMEAAEPKKFQVKPKGLARTLVVERPEGSKVCKECQGPHYLTQCPQFLALTPEARKETAKKLHLCFNCLKTGHGIPKCRSGRCSHCQQKHHSLLCFTSNFNKTVEKLDESNKDLQTINVACSRMEFVPTMCPTAKVKVADIYGNLHECRVLFDTGSQVSLIKESLVKRLGLVISNGRMAISGVNATSGGHTKGKVCLTLFSMYMPTKLEVTAYILPQIVSESSQSSMPLELANKYKHLKLADSEFYNAHRIDILLSIGVVWKALRSGVVKVSESLPIARETIFGWVIAGDLSDLEERSSLVTLCTSIDIDRSLKMLWEMETIQYSKSKRTLIDEEVEQRFIKTTSREVDGKYVVELPLKSIDVSFGDTITGAMQRLHSMERRFSKNQQLQNSYIQFMKEYELMGHMRKLKPEEIFPVSGKVFYLPHHAVVRPDASTTKLRVVFDGSHQDSFGTSLNSMMYCGPPIQRELFSVTLRFRKFPYVFSADIVKMFRMIWLSPKHENYQRILWRERPEDDVQHYVLKTVTYGTSAAPFLSVRVLKQLALDYQTTHPIASRILQEDFYVDDCLHGEFDLQDLITARNELEDLLHKAGLQLQKWRSNSWELLSQTQNENVIQSTMSLSSDDDWGKVLGLFWNPSIDKYTFRINADTLVKSISKRQILSSVAKIFDPLGLISPIVVLFKMLLQQMWSLHTSWDEEAPENIATSYQSLLNELHHIEKIHIPRNIFAFRHIQLHGFSDASLRAYGAVIYARSISEDGECFVNIISSKSKIGPIKKPTIHRLELCAALVLTRLLKSVKSALQLENVEVFAWTDSQVTLRWLMADPCKWQDYVANRTSEILEVIPKNQWRYVRSYDNPADLLSRGLTPAKLVNAEIWWSGPSWLRREESSWPEILFEPTVPDKDEWELRKNKRLTSLPIDILRSELQDSSAIKQLSEQDSSWGGSSWLRREESSWPENYVEPTVPDKDEWELRKNKRITSLPIDISRSESQDSSAINQQSEQYSPCGGSSWLRREESSWPVEPTVPDKGGESQDSSIINQLSKRYSSWQKIIRILAYILRFIDVSKKCTTKFSSYALELAEYNAAKQLLIKNIQQKGFAKEIFSLKSGKIISKKSNISKLCPFLDSNGILRVGGRLKHATIPYSVKHPIVMPKHDELVDSLVRYFHVKYYHAGNEALFVYIRQEFWLVGAKNTIKKITRKCINCFKQKSTTETQRMANLPPVRVQQELPFMNSGCDYAGPVCLRESRRRKARCYKGYICLFVCMVTKSIHLELVTDLSTNTFIAALRRFVGRRGRCQNIYSDNGTNFRGTANAFDELKKLIQDKYHNSLVQTALLEDNINWHFNPARSPHCGGIWETGIRSVKLHLKRVIGDTVLTAEELTTFLVQIEAILNSRPLCRLSDNEIDPLTPMHFLTGRSFASIPNDIVYHTQTSKRVIWESIQNMVNGFWKKWSNDYLCSLQARNKWIESKNNVKVGDIVLLKSSESAAGKWLYGKVAEIFTGSDGLVRIVKVKSNQGIYERHIVNIAVLPIDDNDRTAS